VQRVHVTSSASACCIPPLRLLLDERLADEARHGIPRDRPRGLEGGQRECREIERVVLVRIAAESARERPRAGEPAVERRHDRGIRGVRR
jgi:hypothetical protein